MRESPVPGFFFSIYTGGRYTSEEVTLKIITWTPIVYAEVNHKNKIATICLMLSMFFLPFGYDALFMLIMKWTGSYWTTDIIFYGISAVFLGSYFYFSGVNPFDHFREKSQSLKRRFQTFTGWNEQ